MIFINQEKLRVFEAFAGVGSQAMALRNIGAPYEVVAIAEIDKFAIKSYEAIHDKINNLEDISKIKVEDIPDHDLFTYSFPCQDISLAGKQQGFEKGSGTRSGLLWECERIIKAKKPKYLLLENVKNLVGKKFIDGFNEWLRLLEDLGYTNYWQVLNAKDYGVPQNRERVFVVSILGDHDPYQFPEKEPLLIRLKDILESEVDEKFYLSDEQISKIKLSTFHTNARRIQEKDWSDTLCARDYKDPKCVQVENPVALIGSTQKNAGITDGSYSTALTSAMGNGGGHTPMIIQRQDTNNEISQKRIGGIFDTEKSKHQAGSIWDKDTISPTLDTMQGGWRQPCIIDDTIGVNGVRVYDKYLPSLRANRSGLKTISCNVPEPQIAASRGRYDESGNIQQNLEINSTGYSNTITTVQKDNYVLEGVDVHPTSKKLEFGGFSKNDVAPCLLATDYKAPKTILLNQSTPAVKPNFRIRKLTPKECWRLMGFSDEDFDKASKVNSNSQLYKQAGNSIVVPVLEKIFANLFLKNIK